MKTETKYDIALSFAGEDRVYVRDVADILKKANIRVFYDEFEEAVLWGKNLHTYLEEVYGKHARYTIMFISVHYAKKLWTNHERESAQERAFKERAEYILPARFDDTEIPGLLDTVAYIDLRHKSPYEFCLLIGEKIGKPIVKLQPASANKSQTEIKKRLDDIIQIIQMLKEIIPKETIPTADIDVGYSYIKKEDRFLSAGISCIEKGDFSLIVNVPIALKGSEVDRKLLDVNRPDVQVRYFSGVHMGDPGETLKHKSFVNGSIRPIHLGLRVGSRVGRGTTLGPFVELPNGEPGFLTSAPATLEKAEEHIIINSPVCQSNAMSTNNDGDVIGFIFDFIADVACVNRIRYGVQFLGNVVPVGYKFLYEGETIKAMVPEQRFELPPNALVFKIGATSGLTSGVISAVDFDDVVIKMGSGEHRFDNLIEILTPLETPFSWPGDGGAAVYTRLNDKLFCLGMHFATGILEVSGKKQFVSYCIPIWNLITRLHIKWIDCAVL